MKSPEGNVGNEEHKHNEGYPRLQSARHIRAGNHDVKKLWQ